MGSSSSKSSLSIPLETNSYDRFSDTDETGEVQIERSIVTSRRPMWRYTVALFVAFVAFSVASGVSCAFETSCISGGPPSVGRMFNASRTSLFVMTSVNALIGVHLIEVNAIGHLLKEKAPICAILQWISAMLTYSSIFANLAISKWYITAISAILVLLWMSFVVEGLRRFYVMGHSKLWKITIPLVVFYALSATIYVAFNTVEAIQFPHKDIGVLAAEILVVISASGFCFIMIPHTRWVFVDIVVKK